LGLCALLRQSAGWHAQRDASRLAEEALISCSKALDVQIEENVVYIVWPVGHEWNFFQRPSL
jgi:hypothetical protein